MNKLMNSLVLLLLVLCSLSMLPVLAGAPTRSSQTALPVTYARSEPGTYAQPEWGGPVQSEPVQPSALDDLAAKPLAAVDPAPEAIGLAKEGVQFVDQAGRLALSTQVFLYAHTPEPLRCLYGLLVSGLVFLALVGLVALQGVLGFWNRFL